MSRRKHGQHDRRLCRWYGHTVQYMTEDTTYEPPAKMLKCARCGKGLAGPFGDYQGKRLTVKEMLVRTLSAPTPLFEHFRRRA